MATIFAWQGSAPARPATRLSFVPASEVAERLGTDPEQTKAYLAHLARDHELIFHHRGDRGERVYEREVLLGAHEACSKSKTPCSDSPLLSSEEQAAVEAERRDREWKFRPETKAESPPARRAVPPLPDLPDPNGVYSITQVAEITGRNKRNIYRAIKEAQLEPVRSGGPGGRQFYQAAAIWQAIRAADRRLGR